MGRWQVRGGGGIVFARHRHVDVAGAAFTEVTGGGFGGGHDDIAAEDGGVKHPQALDPVFAGNGHGHLLAVEQAGAGIEVGGLLDELFVEALEKVALHVFTPDS